MDSKIYSDRSENELILAQAIQKLSADETAKEFFGISKKQTFYSAVISHSYYAIFYSAKAILLEKGITTSSPSIHKTTLDAFKSHLVDTGILDIQLLEIYNKLVIRADELLEIFKEEKGKRGQFTYSTIPQTNQEPAEDSIKNALVFVTHIRKMINLS